MTETTRPLQPNESILEEYQRFCEEAYPAPIHTHLTNQARAFFLANPAPTDWGKPLGDEAKPQPEGVLTFLALTGRLQVSFSDLVSGKLPLLELFRLGMPDLKTWFESAAGSLGYADDFVKKKGLRCWLFWAALEGKSPMEVTTTGAQTLRSAIRAHPFKSRWEQRHLIATVYGVHKILFHFGVVTDPPKHHAARQPRMLEAATWTQVHQGIRATVERYLDQFAAVRRPGTVDAVRTGLTQFFRRLHDAHPEVNTVGLLERHHIEEWKVFLANRQGVKAGRLAVGTRAAFFSHLAMLLRNIAAWEWPQAPVRQLVYPNDYPVQDEPLPRFLPDDAAAALLKAAESSDDLFTRVAVTTLLRTGLRRGELIRLTVDCVVKIGSSDWLRVPLGKLHNDRNVPLHPDVRRCIDDWMTARGNQTWTAAMLGHRSLEMTLVYARIANRTVEKEYFNVTRQLDQRTNVQVTIPEGPGMASLRMEMDWRRLGNG